MAEITLMTEMEEDLTCPICLSTYNNPISLSCGHSFCQECIQKAQNCQQSLQGLFSCPLCRAQADPAVELQPNIELLSTEKLLDASAHQEKRECKMQCEEKWESTDQQNEVIPCDFCLQEPQPAIKTCLSCEASLCQAHLSKHNRKSPLKDHILVEPCDDQVLAERRCPQHSKLLECYCQTDSVCICFLCCVTSSHKYHTIVSLEEAFGQVQSVFSTTLERAKTCESALNESIANLLRQEEEVKTKESLQRKQLESLFKELHLQLHNNKREALQTLSQSEKQQLSEIQAEMKKLEEERDAARDDVQELEALRHQKDKVLFVKAFTAIQARKCKPVPSKGGVKLSRPPIILDELRTSAVLKLFQQFLSDMQSSFKAQPVHEHLTASLCTGYGLRQRVVVIYPLSFGTLLDGTIPHLKSEQSFSEGCHFWEVDTSNARSWKLGIFHPESECYLQYLCGSLFVFIDKRMIMNKGFSTVLKVVRVELDCEKNTVSFYNVFVKHRDSAESLSLIETVCIPSKYPAYATFGVCEGSLKLL